MPAAGSAGPTSGGRTLTGNPDPWELRELPDDLTLALAQGDNRVSLDLSNIKEPIAALVDAATDLTKVLAGGGVYLA